MVVFPPFGIFFGSRSTAHISTTTVGSSPQTGGRLEQSDLVVSYLAALHNEYYTAEAHLADTNLLPKNLGGVRVRPLLEAWR